MEIMTDFEVKVSASAPEPRAGFEEKLSQHLQREFFQRRTSAAPEKRYARQISLLPRIAAVIVLFLGGYLLLSYLSGSRHSSSDSDISASTHNPKEQIQLVSLVLPGGHTSPTASGGAQFNFDEVPADLHHLVYEQILSTSQEDRPPTTPQTPIRLMIPAIDVNHPIVQGVDWASLTMGIGQLPNGVTPDDEDGNVVLVAHNDIYGEIFQKLDELEPGMRFHIETETNTYTYVVTSWEIVEPDAVHVMESRGYPIATLISGYPYQVNTHRIVVFADKLIE